MKKGFLVGNKILDSFKIADTNKLEIMKKYVDGLKSIDIDVLTKEEEKYIILHLMSKANTQSNGLFKKKNKEIDSIINDVFNYIQNIFKVKITDKEKLYENLYSHLILLTIRIRFNIHLINPLLKEIKEKMNLSFILATHISEIISKKYDKSLSEDEIGYLAVIIEMSIDTNNSTIKKDILIICPTGTATSKFLKYKFEKIFGEYINCVSTVGIKDLKYIDFKKFDYVFSTTNLDKYYGVKIHKVNWFLENSEILKIKKLFKSHTQIFSKDLYFLIENKMTKKELLKFMSEKVKKLQNSDFDIYSSVMKREELGFTQLYNKIAIPHLFDSGYGFNKIAVAILKHPILWDDAEVNIVLLMCIDDINSFDDEIYKKLADLVSQKDAINKFLKKPEYEEFIKLIGDDNGR